LSTIHDNKDLAFRSYHVKTILAAAVSALALSAPAFAEDKLPRTISVSGYGEVMVVPDMASVNLGVTTIALSAGDALSANSIGMTKVLDTLKASGVAEKDIQTSNLSISPHYEPNSNGGSTQKGFEVTNNVSVTVYDLKSVGGILDKAVASGANQIYGLSFGVKDDKTAMDEARKRAVAEARHRAEIFAGASDVRLGNVISIAESDAERPRMMKQRVMQDAAPAPIAAGEQAISVSVNITWEIK
jgi:uncharacterized protein